MLAVATKVVLVSFGTGLGQSKAVPGSHPEPIIPLFHAVVTVSALDTCSHGFGKPECMQAQLLPMLVIVLIGQSLAPADPTCFVSTSLAETHAFRQRSTGL